MNQQDIASAVAEATGATKAEAAKAVAAVVDAIRDGLERGEKVAIAGFGVFETAERGPSKARCYATFHGQMLIGPYADPTRSRRRPGPSSASAVRILTGPSSRPCAGSSRRTPPQFFAIAWLGRSW